VEIASLLHTALGLAPDNSDQQLPDSGFQLRQDIIGDHVR
jgi:hypothetical protein